MGNLFERKTSIILYPGDGGGWTRSKVKAKADQTMQTSVYWGPHKPMVHRDTLLLSPTIIKSTIPTSTSTDWTKSGPYRKDTRLNSLEEGRNIYFRDYYNS